MGNIRLDNRSRQGGFMLAEAALAVAIFTILAGGLMPKFYERYEQKKLERTALEFHAIHEAAKNYYLTTGHWPCQAASCPDAIGELQATGYLPAAWVAQNAWGNPYSGAAAADNRTFDVSAVLPQRYEKAMASYLPFVAVDPVTHTVAAATVIPGAEPALGNLVLRDGSRAMTGDLDITKNSPAVLLTDSAASLTTGLRNIAGVLTFTADSGATMATIGQNGDLAATGSISALTVNIGSQPVPVNLSQNGAGHLVINKPLRATSIYTPRVIGGPNAGDSIVIDGTDNAVAGSVIIQPGGGQFAVGKDAQAGGTNSTAIGDYTTASAQNAIALGGGTSSKRLTNNIADSLMIGFGGPALTVIGGNGGSAPPRVTIGGTGADIGRTLGVVGDAAITTSLTVPTVYGSTADYGTLRLSSTSSAVKGAVFINNNGGAVLVGPGNTVAGAGTPNVYLFGVNNTGTDNSGGTGSVISGGRNNTVTANAAASTAISFGQQNTVVNTAANSAAVVLGYQNSVTGQAPVVMGNNNTVSAGANQVVMGGGNNVGGSDSQVMGANNSVQAVGTTAVGTGNSIPAGFDNSTIVGNNSTVAGANAIAIGNYVRAAAAGSIMIGRGSSAANMMVNSLANSIAFGVDGTKPAMTISGAADTGTAKVFINGTTDYNATVNVTGSIYATGSIWGAELVTPKVFGSYSSTGNLALDSTSHASKGTVSIGGAGGAVTMGKGAVGVPASNSIAIGPYTKASGTNAITIGAGTSAAALLDNGVPASLAIGFGSAALTVSGGGATTKVNVGGGDLGGALNVSGAAYLATALVTPTVYGGTASGSVLYLQPSTVLGTGTVQIAPAGGRVIFGSPVRTEAQYAPTLSATRYQFHDGSLAVTAQANDTDAPLPTSGVDFYGFAYHAGKSAIRGGFFSAAKPPLAATWGYTSFAYGYDAVASGNYTAALGYGAEATSNNAVAIGTEAKAAALETIALGNYVQTIALRSQVYGFGDLDGKVPYVNNESNVIKFVVGSSTVPAMTIGQNGNIWLGNAAVRSGQLNVPGVVNIGDPVNQGGLLNVKGAVVIGDPPVQSYMNYLTPALMVAGKVYVNNPAVTSATVNVGGSLWVADMLTAGSLTTAGAITADSLSVTSATTGSLTATGGISAATAAFGGAALPAGATLAITGRVDIGTPGAPGAGLNVGGDVHADGYTMHAAAFNSPSDARFKHNIRPLFGALETIAAVKGVSYDWRYDAFPERNFARGRQLGFIAQELEQVLPDLVTTGANGYKSVNYSGMVPLLVEAVKELNAKMVQVGQAFVAERVVAADGTTTVSFKDPATLATLMSIRDRKQPDDSVTGYLAAADVYLADRKQWASAVGTPRFTAAAELHQGPLNAEWRQVDLAGLVPEGTRTVVVAVESAGVVRTRCTAESAGMLLGTGQAVVPLDAARRLELYGDGGPARVRLVGYY